MKNYLDFSGGGLSARLTKKQKAVIAVSAMAVAVLVLALVFRGCASRSAKTERNNTIELVKMYMGRGEYDRALDKIDELLIRNKKDAEALDLLNQILLAKGISGGDGGASSKSLRVEVDTDGLTEAMRNSLESMKSEMARSSRAAEDLVRAQKEQEERRVSLQKAEEARLKAEAAEKEAERRALEERRRAEEAKRKAEEEALARKNAQLKKEIDAVNGEIQQAKTALNSGNIAEALKYFSNAEGKLPVSGGEPSFSASKYSEMAGLVYDASEKAGSQAERERLVERAVEYAAKAVEKDPKEPGANYILGQDAMARKNYQKAIDYYTRAISGDGKNYEYYYNLGRAQFMMKKFAEAKSSFTTAAQLNQNFAPARYNLGLTNLRLNDRQGAKKEFIRAHDIDPRYERAYLEEGRVLVQLGEYQNAIAAYQKVVGLNNVNRAALQELGSVYSQVGNYVLAEESFRKSLALLPAGSNDPLTFYNLSTVLFEGGKPADALSYAKRAYDTRDSIKDGNAKVNIVYNYALLCERTGKSDEAIERYAEVLTLNPNHLKTQINLGVMYMNLSPPDADMALSLFARAYSQDSKNFEANNNLGSAYLEKKDYTNAIKFFQNALQIDQKNNDVRFNLAQAFAGDKQFDNARTTYTELLRLDPKYWDAYVELGKVCMALNDSPSAEKYLVYVEEKNPGYRAGEVKSLLNQLNLK